MPKVYAETCIYLQVCKHKTLFFTVDNTVNQFIQGSYITFN